MDYRHEESFRTENWRRKACPADWSCVVSTAGKDKRQVKKDQPPNYLRLINEFKSIEKNTTGSYTEFLNGFKLEIKEELWEKKVTTSGSNILTWSFCVWPDREQDKPDNKKISYVTWEGFHWSSSILANVSKFEPPSARCLNLCLNTCMVQTHQPFNYALTSLA